MCNIYLQTKKKLFQWKIWKLICTSMLNSAVKFTSHIPLCWSPHCMMWWQTWRSEIRALSPKNCQKKVISHQMGPVKALRCFSPLPLDCFSPCPVWHSWNPPAQHFHGDPYPKGFYLHSDMKLKATLITPPIKMILKKKNRRVLKVV